LTADQLEKIYVTGSNNKLVPLSTFATIKTTTEPRQLNKFQQLNAVTIQGVIPPNVPLDKALSFLEDQAKTILPQGFTVDYAGESRQLRVEGSKFLGTFLLSAIPDLFGSGGTVRELPRSLHHPGGLGSIGPVRGADVFLPGLTTLNIYSQVGLITLVGLVSKKWHPDRGVCQPPHQSGKACLSRL